MRELGIDIETYSSNDLPTCGVYKYVEATDFTILLFAYSVDGGPVTVCDFAKGEQLPDDIYQALRDAAVTKTAFNAAFERVCISHYFGWPLMDPAQWRCTMVRAAQNGLRYRLGSVGSAELADGKMKEGAALIRYFQLPTRKKDGTIYGTFLPTRLNAGKY
jgi:DNA polymerase